MDFDYDLFVLGAGSGGVRASRMSASYGAKAVAESMFLGGTWNVGCVPKKLFVYGSHFHEEFQDAQNYGWDVPDSAFHWPTLRDNKSKEISRLNGIYSNLLNDAGVTPMRTRVCMMLIRFRLARNCNRPLHSCGYWRLAGHA